jgi:hypothetical protein
VAAAANVNAAFFISEASVISGTSTDSPAIVSLRPQLAGGFPPNLILMNGLGKRNDDLPPPLRQSMPPEDPHLLKETAKDLLIWITGQHR